MGLGWIIAGVLIILLAYFEQSQFPDPIWMWVSGIIGVILIVIGLVKKKTNS